MIISVFDLSKTPKRAYLKRISVERTLMNIADTADVGISIYTSKQK